MSMTIEQKMQYIRKALEMGATVKVSFHNITNKEVALTVANQFSNMANVPYVNDSYGRDSWFRIMSYNNKGIDTTVFYEKDKEVSA